MPSAYWLTPGSNVSTVAIAQQTSVLHILAPMREGGLERVVEMMSSGMRAGDRIHVAAVLEPSAADRHPFVLRLESLGVSVTPVVVDARDYLREYRLLTALVTRLKPAVVHTHGYRADVIGGAVARTHRIPAVSTVHGFTGGGAKNRLNERLQCFALRRATAVMAVSRPLVGHLIRAGVPRERVHCVPNGFRPGDKLMPRAAARRALGIPVGELVVGWVGRLSHEKGPDVMLDSLARSDPAWRLSMIGEGRETERLRRRASKLGIGHRITWHGSVADAGSLLTAFDAFALTSRTEGTPISLLEAMYAGVPIVATGVGGVGDVVTAAEAILVPAETPEAIAGGLASIVHDPAAAKLRSVHARNKAVNSFDPASWLATVDSVYSAARACAHDLRY